MSLLVALALLQSGDPYAALGARLPAVEWKALHAYTQEAPVAPPPFVPSGVTPLAAKRLAVERYAPILAGLHALAERPALSVASHDADDRARFEDLERLIVMASEVRFADGDRWEAVTTLLDGLTMARRVGRGSVADSFEGLACEALVMAGFSDGLSQLSLAECERVREVADRLLEELPVPAFDAPPELRSRLNGPTNAWVAPSADPYLIAFVAERTRLRLLRLHMRVEAFRWRNLKLPTSLAVAAPEAERIDPITSRPFGYEPKGPAYRLFAAGFPAHGPLELRGRGDPSDKPLTRDIAAP